MKPYRLLPFVLAISWVASAQVANQPPAQAQPNLAGAPRAQTPSGSGLGSIVGNIYDAANGSAVRSATVKLVEKPEISVTTDLDGRFKIEVSPGTYKVSVSADNYVETTIEGVEVTAGQPTEASTVLPLKGAGTTIEVSEKLGPLAATAETLLAERKLAVSVSDAISGEELRAGTASNAAAALEKVTGVSVVDNGYVYVRGLGERYSSTMLNSAMIPTTEPEKRVVPLDLFPAALIDNIKILKTYSPDLPGEFSGGLVQMNTVEFPTTPLFRVSSSVGFNSRTTFDRFLTYPGGGTDLFGFGDSRRSIPAVIPRDGRLFPGNYTQDQFTQFGRSFEPIWTPASNSSMRPDQSYSIVGGGTFGRLGLVGAISFSNEPRRYDELRNYIRNAGNNQPVIFTNYPDYTDSIETARLGGVFNAAIQLNGSNKVVFRNTLTHDSDKESRIFSGYTGSLDSVVSNERLRFIERGLLSTSVEGEHAVSKLGNSLFRWQFTYSGSSRNEPDLREVLRGQTGDNTFVFLQQSQSGLRFYNYLEDRIYEPQADWSKPFYRGSLSGLFKVGFRATLRSRDFEARRFRFIPFSIGSIDLRARSNALFSSQNIGPNGFQIREETRGTDTYDATMDIYGGYAMVDLAWGPKWRFIGGVRVEDAAIQVNTIDPFVPGAQPSVAVLNNRDPLPGVNIVYALSPRQNLRVGYSRTVARPDFRELSPFEFTNVVGGFTTVGNPNLRRSLISNYDFRWEWFLPGNQLIAASYFFKDFTDPVEVNIQATADFRQSFFNAAGAQNQGVELEFRHGLGILTPRLRDFSLQANFTIVDSTVDVGDDAILTSRERPLVGQSRYIYNLIGEWNRPQWRSNARFYANSVSRRITDVGTFGLPDIYQERNTFMDFVYQFNVDEGGRWNIRFSAENLADNNYLWTQADITQRNYRLGRTFNIGTSFSIF